MKKGRYLSLLPIYSLILVLFIIAAIWGSRTVTVISQNSAASDRTCVVIDPGHGGEDGGATSCTGVLESNINLEIALRLEDLLHLLGIDTVMTRTTDRSIYTQGQTLAAKKVSDLKERVRIVNETENAVLLSIHQNHFSDSRYKGAQVFYAKIQGSDHLAKQLQDAFEATLNPNSNRKSKPADGIYLMQHIASPGVLIECGFLSNPEEEALLRDSAYQKKLCSVIAAICSKNMQNIKIS